MISPSANEFGCGYCRRKGGPAELKEFVDDVKSNTYDLSTQSVRDVDRAVDGGKVGQKAVGEAGEKEDGSLGMQEFPFVNREQPIEEYPGYIGMTWDGEFYPGPELKDLNRFDWQSYFELVDDKQRKLSVGLASGMVEIIFEPYDDMAVFMDQLPTVTVYFDPGPPDGGPASGDGYVFFLADGATRAMLQADIDALLTALRLDHASLKNS
jgi:hypothetical protein